MFHAARELRARTKSVLDAAGIQPTGPDTIVVSAPPAIISNQQRGTSDDDPASRIAERQGGA